MEIFIRAMSARSHERAPLMAVDDCPTRYFCRVAVQQSALPLSRPELYCQLSVSPYNGLAADGEL